MTPNPHPTPSAGEMTAEAHKEPFPHFPNAEPLNVRIEEAIKRITSGQGEMRIPCDPTDPDIVLMHCRAEINNLRASLCFGRDDAIDVYEAKLVQRAEKAEAELSESTFIIGEQDKQLADLRRVVEQLPHTADGVPVVPNSGMPLFEIHLGGIVKGFAFQYVDGFCQLYSTVEAAQQAVFDRNLALAQRAGAGQEGESND